MCIVANTQTLHAHIVQRAHTTYSAISQPDQKLYKIQKQTIVYALFFYSKKGPSRNFYKLLRSIGCRHTHTHTHTSFFFSLSLSPISLSSSFPFICSLSIFLSGVSFSARYFIIISPLRVFSAGLQEGEEDIHDLAVSDSGGDGKKTADGGRTPRRAVNSKCAYSFCIFLY
jgi:hypothetical protein